MPTLTNKTIKIKLPSFPDSEVEMYEKAPFGVVSDLDDNMSNMEAAKAALPRLIIDWNFTDEKGNKLEPILDNILKLPIEDVNYLVEKGLEKVNSSIKKKT